MSRYHSAEKRDSDDFGVKFTMGSGERVYDGKTRHGPWACMSHESWKKHGCGKLGTGYGQLYVRTALGDLVLKEKLAVVKGGGTVLYETDTFTGARDWLTGYLRYDNGGHDVYVIEVGGKNVLTYRIDGEE